MFLHDIPENLMGSFLNMAYSVIAADGKVTEEEKNMLDQYKLELNVKELPKMKEVDINKELDKFARLTDIVKREIFFELFSLTLIDNDFDDSERKIMNSIAKKLSVNKEDMKKMEKINYKIIEAYNELGEIIRKK